MNNTFDNSYLIQMSIDCYRVAFTPIKRLLLLFVACGLFPVSIVQGNTTIHVPADQPTIQAAINAAEEGDLVVVDPGTYFETINFLGKAITLRSSGGPSNTIIDGDMSGSVVQCVNGEGSGTVLEGFTVTRGHADVGAGMLNIGSSPTIIDCIFTDNHADDRGGGMYNREGNPIIIASTFAGNTSVEMGGGMFNFRASPEVTDCIFTQNSSNKGGGMRNYLNSHATVTNSIFSNNVAWEEGGGMDNRKNSNAVVTGCVFEGNTAGSGGGGMHNYVGRAVATGNPIIINCLFFDNSAPSGAGIRNNDPDPTIINTTITYNNGPGISSRNGSAPIIKNSIVWGNSGGSFSGASAGLSDVSYSDIEGGFTGTGNLDENPDFLNSTGNDYHIAAYSPLIDAGDNTFVLLTTDLEGNSRIIGGIVDMGAYEFVASCSADDELDNDNDGYTTCGGDCDDTDDSINPSVTEVCDDGLDNNCNGTIDEEFDSDSDGFTTCGGDCDDNDDSVNPSVTEICDGIDNNCSGAIDEGFDSDNDGYTTCGGDCDDTDDSINPSVAEICDDGFDNDCDSDIDTADSDCGGGTLLPKGESCTQDSQCVSNKCKGGPGKMTCK